MISGTLILELSGGDGVVPRGSVRMISSAIGVKWKYAAMLFGLLLALSLLTVAVGWFWFGWGYIANNKEMLDSLPAPPGVQRTSVVSSSYSSAELVFIPPDGWGTRATHRAPPEVSEEDVVDFYISNLSSQWRYCKNYITTIDLLTRERGVVMAGLFFTKGSARVSVDILNMKQPPHSFDIGVKYNADSDPCD